ncbi:MAG: methyltransferase domain-containing protein [Patescibacteria group bacterium]|jgi:hypothetical protein
MKFKYFIQDITYYLRIQNHLIRLIKNNGFINKLLLKSGWSDYGFNYYNLIYLRIKDFLLKNDIDLYNKKILEIGSGNLPVLGYFFIIFDKIKFYCASDPYRAENFFSKKNVKKQLDIINEFKKRKISEIKDYVNIKEKKNILNKDFIEFINLDITENINIGEKFDIIISNAVLEHIKKEKINQAIKNMNLVLNDGGIMVHEIDFRDHTNFNRPLANLKYTDEEWDKLTKDTIFYTNRLKLSDYIEIFQRNNFEIIDIKAEINSALILLKKLAGTGSDEELKAKN